MAFRTPRILWDVLQWRTASILSASSARTSAPVSFLLDPTPTKVWRSETGWAIGDHNKWLDFTEGTTGDASAEIATGTYTTGAALAAAIESAMNAAATDNTYSVTYSTSTKKFTIARATGSDTFALEWSTGSHASAGKEGSVAPDLGFDDSADDTSATSYEADTASYQSRHWLKVDLGSEIQWDALAVFNHNFSGTAAVRYQANATDAWTAPTRNNVSWEAGPATLPAVALPGTPFSKQWHRLLIDDAQNTDGFAEVGLWLFGSYLEPDRGIQTGHQESGLGLSTLETALQGAQHQTRRTEPRTFEGQWRSLSRASMEALIAMEDAIGVGGPLVFFEDPLNYPSARTKFGSFTSKIRLQQRVADGDPPDRYHASFAFRENLG